MAAKTKMYYAWSRITIADKVKGSGFFVIIPAGDKVTKNQIGEPDWSSLISSGSIRTQPYPKTRSDESPRSAQLRMAKAAMDKALAPFKEPTDDDDDDDDDENEDVTNEGVGVNDDAKLPAGTRNN